MAKSEPLQASGDVSDEPVLGGDYVNDQVGLDEDAQEGSHE